MTYWAVCLVATCAWAIVSMGRVGIRKYPPTADATCRKNMRRPSCGLLQNGAPWILLQSNPKRSFMFFSLLVTQQKIYLIDTHPGQVFDSRTAQGRRVCLGQEGERFRSLVFGGVPRNKC